MRLFVLLALAACSSPPPPPPPPAPRIARIGEHQVDVIVAGERFATLTEDELRAGTRLDLFVTTHPYATWSAIELRGPGKETVTLLRPAEGYVPRVGYAPSSTNAVFELASGADVIERFEYVDEIRIEVAPGARTPLEALSAGCTKQGKAEEHVPTPPKRWRGEAYQFNTETQWTYDLAIDLGAAPVGAHVGSLRAHGRYYDYFTVDCYSDLYRAADRDGRRVVVERVRRGECVDGTMTFACADASLAVKAYYLSGQYVLHGTLGPVP